MQAKKSGLLFILVLVAATATGATTLPFPEDLLHGEQGQSLKEVVKDSTIHHQMSGLRLYGGQAVFEYLSTHPDFAASLAQAAGLLKYTVERRGEAEFWANDHDGLTTRFAILRAESGEMVVYGKGMYKKGIFRIPARVALVMQYAEGRDGDSPYVQNTVAGYLRLDSGFFDVLARLFRRPAERRMEKRVNWFMRKANKLMIRLYEDPESLLQKLPPDTWHGEKKQLRLLLAPHPDGTDNLVQTRSRLDPREHTARRILQS
ncbi:MAG: hypothetical protein ACE5K9_04935 [Candidatus Methylomirabilales bacterium]